MRSTSGATDYDELRTDVKESQNDSLEALQSAKAPDAKSAMPFATAAWSHVRGNPVWVTACVGLPGILVGWAVLTDPYSLLRHLAAIVAFPLALGGVAEVIRVLGRRQAGL